MGSKTLRLGLSALVLIPATVMAAPTELDQYLVNKQILDSSYMIRNAAALNEILDAISDEDSRTLPFQIDQNMLMEKYQISADQMQVEGIITTSDFTQFEKSIGIKDVQSMLKKNTLQNCHLLFEHEFQRKNPYSANMTLSSEKHVYRYSIKNSECNF